MSIVIESPDGQVMFDQNRSVKETTQGISITDSITVIVPHSMRDLVDRIPFCLCPEDVTTLAGWKTLPDKPTRAGACLCVYDVRDGIGCEWMTCGFAPTQGVFYDYAGRDVTRFIQKWMLLPDIEPPFYKELEDDDCED